MTKIWLTLLILVFLLPSSAMAGVYVDYHIEAQADTVWVYLHDCQDGINHPMQDVMKFRQEFLDAVKRVNDDKSRGSYFTVLTSNNGDRWGILSVLAQDPAFSELDFEQMNSSMNSLTKGGRQSAADQILTLAGLEPQVLINNRWTFSDECYFKIYPVFSAAADWVAPVKKNSQDIAHLEHDYSVMYGELQELKNSSESTFALAVMAGATTTQNMFCPEVSGTLFYKDAIMLRANGFHGLGMTEERSIYDQLESTYDKGWGVGFGWRPEFFGPIWLYAGVHSQCNTLTTSEFAGDNTGWFHGGEIGIMLITDHLTVSATYLHGDVKEYDSFVITDNDFRLSLNLGQIWR